MEEYENAVAMYLAPSEFYYYTDGTHRQLWVDPNDPDEFFLVSGRVALPLDALADMMEWGSEILDDE